MKILRTYKVNELHFAAIARCSCGAGLAYPNDTDEAMRLRAWACSRALLGGVPLPADAELIHVEDAGHDVKPFAFWEVLSERSPRACGATTRPAEGAAA